MTHGSLFSGIGGFDLAAEWMGWQNAFHCEINPFCKRILNHYWPKATSYDDIKATDFTLWRGRIDVLSGGFPCQPYSSAGKRKGKEDDRHLWPEMLRAIREIRPGWVVGENVRGLTNWNGGMVFDEVQADLEAEGYEVLPFLLPACAIGAPHRRDRIWFIAYSNLDRFSKSEFQKNNIGQPKKGHEPSTLLKGELTPHASGQGLSQPFFRQFRSLQKKTATQQGSEFERIYAEGEGWRRFPTQSPVCGGDDGLPSELDGVTFSEWRKESLKGLGNAVVPQIPQKIFKAIESFNSPLK